MSIRAHYNITGTAAWPGWMVLSVSVWETLGTLSNAFSEDQYLRHHLFVFHRK